MHSTVIKINEAKLWNQYITASEYYDFYHCNSYNSLDKSGIPFLFIASDGSDFIALPLIVRTIEDTGYYDCTSVWGYPGPISNKLQHELNYNLVNFFQKELTEYCRQQKVVSVFSRLHPIIQQEPYISNIGNVVLLNKTAAIDLNLPPEVQRQQYRKSNKSEINQLRRAGYRVKNADTLEEIDAFVEIYIETMKRVNAVNFYFEYFDAAYFHKLLKMYDARPLLLLAYINDEIAAAGVFIASKHFMQYHVAGTRRQFMEATPMKLIIDEARLLAIDMGLKYLHLGGGVNGSDNDSLFRFKSGFSTTTFNFKIWKWIVDKEVYNHLVTGKLKDRVISSGYFPSYRA